MSKDEASKSDKSIEDLKIFKGVSRRSHERSREEPSFSHIRIRKPPFAEHLVVHIVRTFREGRPT